MNVEFISGILAGAAGTPHAERGLARNGAVRGSANLALAAEQPAESVGQSPETGDRDPDGRQSWNLRQPDAAEVNETKQSPAVSANSDTCGARLDLTG
jgi:hypothetical protein